MIFTKQYNELKAMCDKQKAHNLKAKAKSLDSKANEFLLTYLEKNKLKKLHNTVYGNVTYVHSCVVTSIDGKALKEVLLQHLPLRQVNTIMKKVTKTCNKKATIKYFNIRS